MGVHIGFYLVIKYSIIIFSMITKNFMIILFFREVHKRRYLLQPIALEVFSSDGRNYLLAFPRKVRNKVNVTSIGIY